VRSAVLHSQHRVSCLLRKDQRFQLTHCAFAVPVLGSMGQVGRRRAGGGWAAGRRAAGGPAAPCNRIPTHMRFCESYRTESYNSIRYDFIRIGQPCPYAFRPARLCPEYSLLCVKALPRQWPGGPLGCEPSPALDDNILACVVGLRPQGELAEARAAQAEGQARSGLLAAMLEQVESRSARGAQPAHGCGAVRAWGVAHHGQTCVPALSVPAATHRVRCYGCALTPLSCAPRPPPPQRRREAEYLLASQQQRMLRLEAELAAERAAARAEASRRCGQAPGVVGCGGMGRPWVGILLGPVFRRCVCCMCAGRWSWRRR
jgi:hypothetical protein